MQVKSQDQWGAAQELVSSVSGSSSAANGNSASTSEGAAMAAVELEIRRRMSALASTSSSSSGHTEEQALPQLILSAFKIKGHTMSCAIDLRSALQPFSPL